MSTLKNPQLTLYAFHLRNELTQGPQRPIAEASEIWEQLTTLGEKLNSPELSALKTKLLCYQNAQYQPEQENHYPQAFIELIQPERILPFSTQSPNLTGEIYPRRLHDTYAVELQFNYTGTVTTHELHCLNPNQCLSLIKPSLGQTLFLVAEPTETLTSEASKTLAQNCVEALFPTENRPTLENTGQLFGGAFFEYDTSHENPAQNTHVLIWLKTAQDPPAEINQYVLNLLNCQHKIKWAYYQSRHCNRNTQQLYSELKLKMAGFNTTTPLKELEDLLHWLSPKAIDYTNNLSELTISHTAIVTNTRNYQGWLARIQHLLHPKDDLAFWQWFGDETCQQYQLQIEGDKNTLQPGLALSQQTVNTVQGLTQIKTLNHESKKQEQLEYLVVFVASILESAAISAKVDYNHHLSEHLLGSYYDSVTDFIGTHLTGMLTHLSIGIPFALSAIGLLWVLNRLLNRFKQY